MSVRTLSDLEDQSPELAKRKKATTLVSQDSGDIQDVSTAPPIAVEGQEDHQESHVEGGHNLSLVDVVLSQYQLLRLILSRLNAVELGRASCVSRWWRQTAAHITRHRRRTRASIIAVASQTTQALDQRTNRRLTELAVEETDSSSSTDSLSTTAATAEGKLLAASLRRCWQEPLLVLAVSCRVPANRNWRAGQDSWGVRLPLGCCSLSLRSQTGCIAGSEASGGVLELQLCDNDQVQPPSNRRPACLTGVLVVPRVDGVQTGVCRVKPRRNAHQRMISQLPKWAADSLRAIVLLYSSGKGARCAQRIVRMLWRRHEGRLAVAGGWVDHLASEGSPIDASSVVMVYFSGDGVRAASLVVGDSSCDSVGTLAVSEVLAWPSACALLADEGFTGGASCVALVMACLGRGNYCQPPQRESDELRRRMTRDTAVCGVYVNGEVGATFLPRRSAKVGAKWRQQVDDDGECFMLTYTTTVLMLEFTGPLLSEVCSDKPT